MFSRAIVTAASYAAYGATLGLAHSPLYAARNLVKLPLLILVTGSLCSLVYGLSARAVLGGSGRSLASRLVLTLFHDLGLLLFSLAPANALFAWSLLRVRAEPLGESAKFLAWNLGFVALAGSLALVLRGFAELRRRGAGRRASVALLGTWLFVTGAVGGQCAFLLRPFFGVPATRDQVPPFALGTRPDVRGAKNFFEMVVLSVENPPLPKRWR